MHSRHKSRGGSGATMSSHRISRVHKHKRNMSSRSQATVGTRSQNTSIDAEEESFGSYETTSLAPLEDALTESLPSLVGSGSSRPVSWFSSYPNSPMPPLRPSDLKLLAQLENSIALDEPRTPPLPLTRKELRQSGSSIVSDLKQGSPGNRIIAAISPEEAILLARIRRNRHDRAMPPSPSLSESTSRQSEIQEQRVWKAEPPASPFTRRIASAQSVKEEDKMRHQSILPPAINKRFSITPPATSARRSVRPSPLQTTGRRSSVRLSSEYLRGRVKSQTQSFSASPPDTPAFGDFPSPPTSADVEQGGSTRGRTPPIAGSMRRSTVRTVPVGPSPPGTAASRGRSPTSPQFLGEEEEEDDQSDVLEAWRALGGSGA